eukprot:754556-Hanusia_phi.AAC.1
MAAWLGPLNPRAERAEEVGAAGASEDGLLGSRKPAAGAAHSAVIAAAVLSMACLFLPLDVLVIARRIPADSRFLQESALKSSYMVRGFVTVSSQNMAEGAKSVGWGILGTADIARKVVRAVSRAANSRLVAIGSRTMERVESWCEQNQIPTDVVRYGNYEEVLRDGKVDVVYIPLPTSMHKEWVAKAAEAGKHVLCEKPVGMNVQEVEEMIACCQHNNVQFMDGTSSKHEAGGCCQEVCMVECMSNIVKSKKLDDYWPKISVQTQRVIDAIMKSAECGQPIILVRTKAQELRGPREILNNAREILSKVKQKASLVFSDPRISVGNPRTAIQQQSSVLVTFPTLEEQNAPPTLLKQSKYPTTLV